MMNEPWIFDDSVATRFQHEAESHIPSYNVVINKSVDFAKKTLQPDDLIIDVGSALGFTINKFKAAGFKNVIGVDNSTAMIEKSLYSDTIVHSSTLPVNKYKLVLINWTLHFILDKQEFKNLKQFIDKCLYDYVEIIYGSNPYITKLKVTQSWLNYTNKNEYHHTHNHPNSLVSGVFYFNADEQYDEISFFNPKYNQIELPIIKYTDYNVIECALKIKTGDLVLFPSSLQHAVPTKVGDNERISLAFNTFVSGELGKAEHLNYLKL